VIDACDMGRTAISWTGGKDSNLALHEAEGLGSAIDCLVTFAPGQESLLAHPLGLMALQAQALGLPHYVFNVEEPYEEGYEDAILSVKKKRGINALVTGDITEIAGHDTDWMSDRCARCGIDLVKPLWHRNRRELLEKILSLDFKAFFSCVKKPWFTDEWLGLELSPSSVNRLIEINKRTGLDICGEQGEYHTMVLDGPQFKKRIRYGSFSKQVKDEVMYVSWHDIELENHK
jgi:uncharacterized protein (TIGR00290 family)